MVTDDMLHRLAFDNTLQANIITKVHSGEIIIANNAACKLLGYSIEELLTQSRDTIFDINESSFKKMLQQRTAEAHSIAFVQAIKKGGRHIPCEIKSAVFLDTDAVEKAITTITDLSQSKTKQKGIDAKKEKIVAENIKIAQSKSDVRLAENNEWIKNIGKTSYDVMWDWDIATGEIYVGDSIEEVFGYKVKNNTMSFNNFTRSLLQEEKDAVEKNILNALTSGQKSWDDSYMIRRQDGSVASTVSRASIIRDEKGKALSLIGATQDVSRLQELKKKLEVEISIKREQSEIFQLAAKLSYDGIWEWNLLTNGFYLREGFKELFGYDIRLNNGNMTDWSKHLHPDDREAVEKGLRDSIASSASKWEQSYRFIKGDGSIAHVFSRARIIRDADGKAYHMIGVIHDLSRQKELEERLEHEIATNVKRAREYKQRFDLIFNSTSDILFDIDLATNQITLSDAYEKEFGHIITENMTPVADWTTHIHKDDLEAVMQDYFRKLATDDTEWKYSYRYLRSDHSIAHVLSNAIILRNAMGKAYRIIGSIQDISKQSVSKKRPDNEIGVKEKLLAEAMEEAKETERSDIGKELHDNVNQLLGASRLYIDLARHGGKNSEIYLNRSSEYTLTAIEAIRKLTKGLTTDIVKNLGLSEAIGNVVRDTMETSPIQIICSLKSFKENSVNNKFKLNIFRIVQEQLNNILKHSKATEAIINLSQKKQSITLTILDNGVGFNKETAKKGVGLASIESRAASYNGIASFISRPGHGVALTVIYHNTAQFKVE
jgi:PAS domain S-box-containing protein